MPLAVRGQRHWIGHTLKLLKIYLKRLIRGSIKAFKATARAPIETKNAVIFSINAFILDVSG